MERYVSYKAVIQQAELMAMPPEAVVAFLKKRSTQTRSEWMDDQVPEEAEAALASRGEPLIDLALAKFGRHVRALSPMFRAAPPASAIRLAILSNQAVGGGPFDRLPIALVGTEEETATWIATAPYEELAAMFENERINDCFLRDLLEAKKPWDAVPEERLANIVIDLCRNQRMRTPYPDGDDMDGYGEYTYNAVFDAAWMLSERVTPTRRWAIALSALYQGMFAGSHSLKEPLATAQRWHANPADEADMKDEADNARYGYVGSFQGVRKGMARLALQKDPSLATALMASGDVAYRAAVYQSGNIGKPELMEAFEQDGKLVYNEAVHNHYVWRQTEGRNALSNIGWKIVQDDKHSDLTPSMVYKAIHKEHVKNHPEWFGNDEATVEPSDEPATKADLQAVVESLGPAHFGPAMENIGKALALIVKRVDTIWWFSLGALVMGVWYHWR